MLLPSASGLRHLRWAREIAATLEAHANGTSHLGEEDRKVLAEEAARVQVLVQRLSGAVKPYRDFLERGRVLYRGRLRASAYVVERARGHAEQVLASRSGTDVREARELLKTITNRGWQRALAVKAHRAAALQARQIALCLRRASAEESEVRTLANEFDEAASLLGANADAFERMEEEERHPRKLAVRAAINELRGELLVMNNRLSARFSSAFIESIYPALARGGTCVADEEDEDDDATAAA